jgi:hypothetical protein
MTLSAAAFTHIATLLLAAGLVASSAPLDSAAPVRSPKVACERVKARVSAVKVLALHSNRHCDGICSTNMGWFAVDKRTGRVFDWDVAEMKLGQPVKSHR